MPLDPYLTARLHLLDEMTEFGGFDTADGRARWDEFFAPPASYQAPQVVVAEHSIKRENAPSLRVITYRASRESSGAGLVWLHGGGFAGGSTDMFEGDGVARELAARTGGTVISVDYRLATAETVFPAPVDDVVDAWLWTAEHVQELGIGHRRPALGGASAGAALAAAAIITLRDGGFDLPPLGVLAYPVLHPVLPSFTHELAAKLHEIPAIFDYTPSSTAPRSNPLLRTFLGAPEWSANSHAMASLAPLGGLPPMLILNAEYDALRASGQAFAAALAEAGDDVHVWTVPGVLHGHLNLPPVLPAVEASLQRITQRLQELTL